MDTDQNWYRQLLALVLVSASKAAVDFITNQGSREDAVQQLRGAFSEIDYDALANAMTKAINQAADTSKDALDEAIDALRERSVDAVGDAKHKAEKQLGNKKGGGKLRLLIVLLLGGAVAYFMFDEQRRNDLLDKLTGASGPIQQSTQTFSDEASDAMQEAADAAEKAAHQTESNQTDNA